MLRFEFTARRFFRNRRASVQIRRFSYRFCWWIFLGMLGKFFWIGQENWFNFRMLRIVAKFVINRHWHLIWQLLQLLSTKRLVAQLLETRPGFLMPCACYNQRGPLETPFFRHFLRLVLSCINADFCVQGRIFQHFSSSTFFPLHHSRFLWFFRTFALFLAKFDAILVDFLRRQQIL